jgi:hypothetical protein
MERHIMKKLLVIAAIVIFTATSASAYTAAELNAKRNDLTAEYARVKTEMETKLKLIGDRIAAVDKLLVGTGETKLTVPTTEEYDAAVAK